MNADKEVSGPMGSLFADAAPVLDRRAQPDAEPERTLTVVQADAADAADAAGSSAGSPLEPRDDTSSSAPVGDTPHGEASQGAATAEAAPTTETAKKPKRGGRRSRKTAAATAPSPAAQPAEPVERGSTTLMVPASIRAEMKRRHEASGVSYTELVLAAVETTYEKLPDVFAKESPVQLSGKLFSGNYANKARTLKDDESYVQINIRPTQTDEELLDGLVASSGARSLTHYVSTALRAYLKPPKPDKQ